MRRKSDFLQAIDEEKEKKALRILASSPTKFCISVLNFEPFPYQAKMLEDPSKNVIICAARRVGKTYTMAAKAIWFAYCHPETTTLIVASTQRQSIIMFDKLLTFIHRSELLKESVVRQTRTLINLSNGSRIIALPCGRTGNTIRGENADLIIVDEAAFVPEDVILSVMRPMLATTDGTMIMLSTPFDKSHFFFRAFNIPTWSKHKFKTSDNPTVKKEFLEQTRVEMGEKRFKQEFLGEFVDDERTYFPMELLRPCIHVCDDMKGEATCAYCETNRGKSDPSGELYGGYDPGGLTDPAALVVVQKVPGYSETKDDEEEFRPAFRVVLTRTLSSGKVKDEEIYAKFDVVIADIHKKSPMQKVLVDSGGIGTPILSHCKQLGIPVEGLSMHKKSKEELFSNLKILFERRKVEIPDSMELVSSLNSIVVERTRTGGYSFTHESGTHDDLACALALAVLKAGKSGIILASFSQANEVDDDHSRWIK